MPHQGLDIVVLVFDMSNLSGYSAESLIASIARGAHSSPFTLSAREMLSSLRSTRVGRKRLDLAMTHLLRSYNHEDGIPDYELQDIAFGLDICILWKGYRVGIDVTVNPTAIGKKIAQKEAIADCYERVGLDLVLILEVNQKPTTALLCDAIRTAVRSGEFISHAVI